MPRNRKKSNKKMSPVFHIFCEGEKTEPGYLNEYLRKFFRNNPNSRFIKIEKTKKNTPKQLVEVAMEMKKDRGTPDTDVFWVVYDRESTVKYTNNLHQQAIDKAQRNKINVAISNVCFEIWILLHFTNSVAQYSNCDDLLKKSKLKQELKEIGFNDYDKANSHIFEQVLTSVTKAKDRAEKMNNATISGAKSGITEQKPYLLNPYTTVYKLLNAIDDFICPKKHS